MSRPSVDQDDPAAAVEPVGQLSLRDAQRVGDVGIPLGAQSEDLVAPERDIPGVRHRDHDFGAAREPYEGHPILVAHLIEQRERSVPRVVDLRPAIDPDVSMTRTMAVGA